MPAAHCIDRALPSSKSRKLPRHLNFVASEALIATRARTPESLYDTPYTLILAYGCVELCHGIVRVLMDLGASPIENASATLAAEVV